LRNLASAVAGFAALAILVSTAPARAEVRGAYLEARNADLYPGSCARETEGDGRDAIVAWQVESGDFGGVPLAGLSVVAVIRGESALSAPPVESARPHSVIFVDQAASLPQRAALEAMARAQAGQALGEVVKVEAVAIELAVDPSRALGRLHVAGLAELRTRPFNRLDSLCGDEKVAAPPLAQGVDATPAVALEHAYHGDALGTPWDAVNGRGAFVGTFGR